MLWSKKAQLKDEPLWGSFPEMRPVDPREQPPQESVVTKRIIPSGFGGDVRPDVDHGIQSED